MSLFFIFLFFCYFGAMICWVDGKVGGITVLKIGYIRKSNPKR